MKGLQKNKNVNSSKMKAVTFYLIMFCDFKFILWINCEAELIREEKQKMLQSAAFGIVCYFLPDAA
ncbi:hypothetical protein ACULNC_09355 [Shigella flexneri]